MLKTTLVSLVLASSLLIACHDRVITVPQLWNEIGDRPGQMTVTGRATLDVSPDCADLTMTLAVEELRAVTAGATMRRKQDSLLAALAKVGVASSDVKLSQVTLEPVYERTEGWLEIRVIRYRAQLTVVATTHDFASIGAIMEAGAGVGVTGLSSKFRRSDLPALKKQVREMALAAAREKAEQLADGVGIKLGRATAVVENPGGSMWTSSYFSNVSNAVASNAPQGEPLVGAGEPLTLDISISYELPRPT